MTDKEWWLDDETYYLLKCGKLEKKLEIAVKALKKYQKAIKEFKKDPMNNLVMLSHQVIYDIYMDTQKTLKEMEEV
jgi:hypothetical protein